MIRNDFSNCFLSFFNPNYTFENFVVNSSNQLSHAASIAVTEMIGTKYNPLFIYGKKDLDKTHLIHAIGNEILRKRPKACVCYISSEQFMRELTAALVTLSLSTIRAFRRCFQELDVLLMDDIQFIAGKDRPQEEFFHVFNSLYEKNKQIVITSDRHPQEIQNLEERLCFRLQWGLIVDVQK